MTVKQLVEHLDQFDPNEEVYLVNGVGAGSPLRTEDVFKGEMSLYVWETRQSVEFTDALQIYAGW